MIEGAQLYLVATAALAAGLMSGVFYAFSSFVMTAAYHVPRNNALEATSIDASEAASVWDRYQKEWTRWNHVRALTSMIASLAFTIAIVLG